MTLWQWALIGLGVWLGVSLLALLGILALVEYPRRQPSRFEHDWASAPLTRDRAGAPAHVLDRVEDEEAILVAGRR
jgi:hypothetical protein